MQKLEDIAAELEDDMERGGWTGRTVTLKYKLDTYEVFTRAKSFNHWIKTKAELYEAGKELLQPSWPLRLRLIGLRVTKLKDLRKKEDGIIKVRALLQVLRSLFQYIPCWANARLSQFFKPLSDSPHSPSKKAPAYDSDDGRDSDVELIELDSAEDELNHNASGGEDEDELPPDERRASTSGHCPPPPPPPPPPVFAPPALETKNPSSLVASSPSKSSGTRSTTAQTVSALERDAVSRKPRSDPSGQRVGHGAGRTAPKSLPDRAGVRPKSSAVAGECPLCTRSFSDNDELNAHIDWCLSREAIRSAQVEGDERERRKKPMVDSVRHPKEWWKGGSVESTVQSRKPKRRKLEG